MPIRLVSPVAGGRCPLLRSSLLLGPSKGFIVGALGRLKVETRSHVVEQWGDCELISNIIVNNSLLTFPFSVYPPKTERSSYGGTESCSPPTHAASKLESEREAGFSGSFCRPSQAFHAYRLLDFIYNFQIN